MGWWGSIMGKDRPQASSGYEDVDRCHLADIDDGCGCVELWEHLSATRDTDAQSAPD